MALTIFGAIRFTMKRIFYMEVKCENKTFIGVWLDDEEYNHLFRLCTTSGLNAGAVLRQILSGTQLRPRPPDQYTALLRELSAIDNDVNQIVHWANVARSIREPEIV